ncbi:unnamed protein product [Linum tenue]|uniref:Myb-like protein X n=1 Tax=Linum tenue TaxID=586396 RepID=A0AAV0KW40_9ROSI|nr:unnamed protein product [Linum tenue]
MSRCFPFPPPGYEKKIRIDDADLLTKEKHKEKKHKKDKKHKEKREDKDRKDKDRTKEKHREKKQRKEKDKDKEKEGDKAKNRTSDEKRVEGQNTISNQQKAASSGVNEIKDSKFIQELAKRIKDDGEVSPSQMVHKIAAPSQTRAEPRGISLDRNVGNLSKEKEKIKGNGEDHWKANGQRDIVDANEVENPCAQNFTGIDKHRTEDPAKQAAKKNSEKPTEGREKKKKHKESKADKVRDKDRGSRSKNKERDKEKKKEERTKEVREPGKDQILKESQNSLDSRHIKTSDLAKLSTTTFGSEGTIGKHKELEDEMLQEPGPRLKEINNFPLDFRNIKTSNPSKPSRTTFSVEGTPGKPQTIEVQILEETVPKLKEREKDPLDFRIVKPLEASNNATFNNEGTLVKRKELDDGGHIIIKESIKETLDFQNIKTSDASKLSSTTFSNDGTLGKRKELDDRGRKLKESIKDSQDFWNIKTMDISKLSSTALINEGAHCKRKELDGNGQKTKESKNHLDFQNNKISDPLMLCSTALSSEGTLGKRKELEVNEHMLDNGHRPSKLRRTLASSDSVIQNGRKAEPFQATVQLASDKQEAAISHGVDIKERKINGFITAEQSNSCPLRPPSANVPAAGSKETVKSPHPDAKYLDQILFVPEGVDLPDFCNQDWLYSGIHQSKKPRKDSPEVHGTKQVWAEALRIESAEVSALPYVIPY